MQIAIEKEIYTWWVAEGECMRWWSRYWLIDLVSRHKFEIEWGNWAGRPTVRYRPIRYSTVTFDIVGSHSSPLRALTSNRTVGVLYLSPDWTRVPLFNSNPLASIELIPAQPCERNTKDKDCIENSRFFSSAQVFFAFFHHGMHDIMH